MAENLFEILMIEDNATDAHLVAEALREHKVENHLTVLVDGERVRAYLSNIEAAVPDLIIMDLNIPKSIGVEMLERIRGTRGLERVPIVVLTSSDSPADMRSVKSFGVSEFLPKPPDLDAFLALGGRFKDILHNHELSAQE